MGYCFHLGLTMGQLLVPKVRRKGPHSNAEPYPAPAMRAPPTTAALLSCPRPCHQPACCLTCYSAQHLDRAKQSERFELYKAEVEFVNPVARAQHGRLSQLYLQALRGERGKSPFTVSELRSQAKELAEEYVFSILAAVLLGFLAVELIDLHVIDVTTTQLDGSPQFQRAPCCLGAFFPTSALWCDMGVCKDSSPSVMLASFVCRAVAHASRMLKPECQSLIRVLILANTRTVHGISEY